LDDLKKIVASRKAKAAVIGLGYVGLPLAVEMLAAGFEVIGIDLDRGKIASLENGKSYILDVEDEIISRAIESGRFVPTSDFSNLASADTVSICVPTPLSKSRDPDISFILAATEEIRKYLRQGLLLFLFW
jgi:UDP-N-acetyl-D-glucosamine dehydrogenase